MKMSFECTRSVVSLHRSITSDFGRGLIQLNIGDDTIFQDLGLDAKKHDGVPTTWGVAVKHETE